MSAGRRSFGLLLAGVLLSAVPAAAQGVGFQAGMTIDPEQFYVGSHVELPLGSDDFLIRPGIDGGFGDNLTIASITTEFLYRFELANSGWALYQGGGPVVNIVKFNNPFLGQDETDVGGGFNYVFGFAHQQGFFTEFKTGGGSGGASLKFGIGFILRRD